MASPLSREAWNVHQAGLSFAALRCVGEGKEGGLSIQGSSPSRLGVQGLPP